MKNIAAVILAAGIGKRMQSKTPKVLHKIGKKPMILRTIENIRVLDLAQVIVVANKANINKLKKILPKNVDFAIQKVPKGTADAVEKALVKVKEGIENVLVLNGDDSAFYKPETINRVIEQHAETNNIQTFLSLRLNDPTGLGRVLRSKGKLQGIAEEKDATANQKKIRVVNAGLYVFNKKWLQENLPKIAMAASGEKYLVDLVHIASKAGDKVSTYELEDASEWHSINTKQDLNLANKKFNRKIHIMGIAGAGASAVAGIAKSYGYDISGCDILAQSSYTKKTDFKIMVGHSGSHLQNIAMLIFSPAVIKNNAANSEVIEAQKQKIPTLTWQEFQGNYLQKGKYVISVAGGYGKSTTTAMISCLLENFGLDPTCEIGATVLEWGKNYRVGNSKYYVNEADEYNDNFLHYKPDIAVILNTAWDHPDYFKDKKTLIKSYSKFINNIKINGYLVIGKDGDLGKLVKFIRKDINVIYVKNTNTLSLSIIGSFRKENAAAVLAVAQILQIDQKKALKVVQKFRGIARRLEFKGTTSDVKIFDDYAVQPFTVLTTANALKEKYEDQRMVLVFEPHTFSRIETFWEDFVSNLKKINVEKIVIAEVFAAREKGDAAKLSKKLVAAVGAKAVYGGSIKECADYLKKNLKGYDIILSMGAGNAYKIYDYLKN